MSRANGQIAYYWPSEDNQIFMLVAYPKSVKVMLTDKETAILRNLVKEL
jgi:hypothetical protein